MNDAVGSDTNLYCSSVMSNRLSFLLKGWVRAAPLQRQLLEHDLEEREQEYRYHQERAKSLIPVDENAFISGFGTEEVGFNTTTMNVPLFFSDEGGSTDSENENDFTNVSWHHTHHIQRRRKGLETRLEPLLLVRFRFFFPHYTNLF